VLRVIVSMYPTGANQTQLRAIRFRDEKDEGQNDLEESVGFTHDSSEYDRRRIFLGTRAEHLLPPLGNSLMRVSTSVFSRAWKRVFWIFDNSAMYIFNHKRDYLRKQSAIKMISFKKGSHYVSYISGKAYQGQFLYTFKIFNKRDRVEAKIGHQDELKLRACFKAVRDVCVNGTVFPKAKIKIVKEVDFVRAVSRKGRRENEKYLQFNSSDEDQDQDGNSDSSND